MTSRAAWATATDSVLLSQCGVDTYRASGPGGQKRNKTSSAVRLRHLPSGILVIAEESRSQHENKAKALVRLRRAFYLLLREHVEKETAAAHPDWPAADGRIDLGKRDPRFWPAAGIALDALQQTECRVSEAAEWLGVGTANLVSFLEIDPKLWQQANVLRAVHGQKPLRSST